MASRKIKLRAAVHALATTRVLRPSARQQKLTGVTKSTTRQLRPSTLRQRLPVPAKPTTTQLRTSTSTSQEVVEPAAAPELEVPTSFELFPKLPTELRLKIFEDACPKDDQLLKVHATFHHSDPEMGMYLTFEVLQASRAARNFGLLGACTMSRQVYLKLHPNFLPGGSKSKIHYNANNTIVFIENFTALLSNRQFAEGILGHYRKQAWFKTIRNLAVPFAFFQVSRIPGYWWGRMVLPHAIKPFKNLERLIGVVEGFYIENDYYSNWAQGMQKVYIKSEAAAVKGVLERYNRRHLAWKAPTVETIDK
jgi:hypothetical protein